MGTSCNAVFHRHCTWSRVLVLFSYVFACILQWLALSSGQFVYRSYSIWRYVPWRNPLWSWTAATAVALQVGFADWRPLGLHRSTPVRADRACACANECRGGAVHVRGRAGRRVGRPCGVAGAVLGLRNQYTSDLILRRCPAQAVSLLLLSAIKAHDSKHYERWMMRLRAYFDTRLGMYSPR
jgi:hypothetical protein